MTKKELDFYKKSDLMMNRGFFKYPLKKKLKKLFFHDYIMSFLFCMRKETYYMSNKGIINAIKGFLNHIRYKKLSLRLGFSIATDVFGYGLVIPHYGTIVVGEGNIIGNYAVLHTSTCITSGKKKIGNGLYLSTGAKIINDIELGDNISIGANALLNKSISKSGCLVAGIPANFIKESDPWFKRDGEKYEHRVIECEKLKSNLNIF